MKSEQPYRPVPSQTEADAELERRRILHVNVTAHPHAAWAAQQVVEALGPDAPTAARLTLGRDARGADEEGARHALRREEGRRHG